MNSKTIVNLIKIAAAALFVFFLGYFRNYLFLTINAQTSAVYYHEPGPQMPSFLQFISTKNYMYLIRLKWILTIVFSLVFFAASMLILKLFFKEAVYLKICVFLYVFLVMAAALITGIGYIFRPFSLHAFNIARNIMHISQSPFTILFLCIVAYYHHRTSQR